MSAVLTSQFSTKAWLTWRRPVLALLALWAGLFGLYWHTLVVMIGVWSGSETFTHAFLVLPISLWLVWRDRQRLASLQPRAQPWVVLPMALAAFVWLLGDLASVNVVTQAAFVCLLVLAVPAICGLAVARAMAFPLLFLMFMVPIGDFMLPWLMEWTADFTVAAIQFSGVPVYREGLQFVIPSGTWSVVEACSGVRYMIASVMVGSLFAYLNFTTLRRRLIFCGVALLVPLIANWVRAYMIVMLGHLSNNKLAVGVDHLVYGWVFFGVIIMVMFLIGARWAQPARMYFDQGTVFTQPPTDRTRLLPLVTLLALVAVAAPHGVNLLFDARERSAPSAPLLLPALASLQGIDSDPVLVPITQNATSTAVRSWRSGAAAITVHVAYYRHQRYGRKLVSSSNSLVSSESSDWQRTRGGSVTLNQAGRAMTWRSTELLSGSVAASQSMRKRLDVRQIYWVDGRFTDSDARATAYLLLSRLLGRSGDGALITIYTGGDDNADTAARLADFAQRHLDSLERQLVAYRDIP